MLGPEHGKRKSESRPPGSSPHASRYPGPSAKAAAAAAKPKAMGKPKAKVLGIQSHVMPIASRMSRILTRVTEMRTE